MRAPNTGATLVQPAATAPSGRHFGRWLPQLVALAAAAGCAGQGGAGEGAQSPQALAKAAAAAEAQRPKPAPSPEGLVLLASVPASGTTLDRAGRMGRQPRLRSEAEALLARQLPAGLFDALDPNRPFLVAGVLSPEPGDLPKVLAGFSVGLRGTAKLVDLSVMNAKPAGPGTFAFESDSGLSCWFRGAPAASPPRLACAESQPALEALGEYLTRGAAVTESSKKAAYLEVYAKPVWERFGERARALGQLIPVALGALYTGEEDFDSALMDGARGLFHEALLAAGDLSRVEVSTELLESSGRLEVQTRLALEGRSSWLAQTIADAGATMGPAPDIFWALPDDALAAGYWRASEASRAQEAWRLAALLVGNGGTHLGAKATTAAQARKAVESLSALRGPYVEAWLPTGASSGEGHQLSIALGGVEDPEGRAIEVVEGLAALLSDPGLRAAPSASEAVLGDKLPELVRRPSLPGLPGSVVYEVVEPEGLAGPLGELRLGDRAVLQMRYLAALHSGTRSWLAAGPDAEQLAQRLALVTQGPASGQLSARSGLEPLRETAATAAGFWELGLLLPPELLEGRDLRPEDLPNQARGLSFAFGKASAEGAVFDVDIEMHRESLEDLALLLLRPSASSARALSLPSQTKALH